MTANGLPNTASTYTRTAANTRKVTNLMREFRACWYRDGWPLQEAKVLVNMDMTGPTRATGHDGIRHVQYAVNVWSPNQSGDLAVVDVANGTYWVRPFAHIKWPELPVLADEKTASFARYALGYGMSDRPVDPSTGEPANLRPYDQAAYRARYQLEDLVTNLHNFGFTPLPYSATPAQY